MHDQARDQARLRNQSSLNLFFIDPIQMHPAPSDALPTAERDTGRERIARRNEGKAVEKQTKRIIQSCRAIRKVRRGWSALTLPLTFSWGALQSRQRFKGPSSSLRPLSNSTRSRTLLGGAISSFWRSSASCCSTHTPRDKCVLPHFRTGLLLSLTIVDTAWAGRG